MATKYGVKLTYKLNGNLPFGDALTNLSSDDELYKAEFPTWATQWANYMTEHAWNGPNNIKIKSEVANDELAVTYLVEGATAENVETLQRLHIWASDLHELFRWREEYYSAKGIQLLNAEVVTLTV